MAVLVSRGSCSRLTVMRFETIVNEKRPKLPRRRIARKGGNHYLAEGDVPGDSLRRGGRLSSLPGSAGFRANRHSGQAGKPGPTTFTHSRVAGPWSSTVRDSTAGRANSQPQLVGWTLSDGSLDLPASAGRSPRWPGLAFFPAILAAQENATSQPLHIRRRLGNLMHDGVIWLTDARADLPTRTIYSRRLESP